MLTDDEGRPTGVILTIRDQAGVRDLKERMRRADRLATLGMIAAGIAHEVKNPLVGIRGAAQLMKSELRSGRETGPESQKSLTEYLDVILKESDRLNKVLEGILDFTRIKPREMKASNIHSVLDRVLLLNEESARQRGIVLARLYDPSLPEVYGSEDQLIQVFLNIIKNAIEAMPKGGKLTIVTRMSDLFTTVQSDGRKYQLMVVKVSDSGRGIKQEHLQDIFTPFFTTKDRGVGLGLALSYQIVQEHLGTIRVESQENEGTTFSVYLPLAG
jgi:two-component system nitrogen regulation sensor histidine kinase GlnL